MLVPINFLCSFGKGGGGGGGDGGILKGEFKGGGEALLIKFNQRNPSSNFSSESNV